MKRHDADFILQPRCVLVGPQVTKVTIDINKSHKAVRIGFHPGGLHRLLGLPLCELLDESLDASEVFGYEITVLNEKLHLAENFEEIRILIETFLLSKIKYLKQLLPFDSAILELMKSGGNLPVEHVASHACLSLRQFERVSKERLGMPPKQFARIIRFSKAYRIHERNPQASWTHIAHQCGYFDQMHLIRDFKEFAGATPRVIEYDLKNTAVKLQATMTL